MDTQKLLSVSVVVITNTFDNLGVIECIGTWHQGEVF